MPRRGRRGDDELALRLLMQLAVQQCPSPRSLVEAARAIADAALRLPDHLLREGGIATLLPRLGGKLSATCSRLDLVPRHDHDCEHDPDRERNRDFVARRMAARVLSRVVLPVIWLPYVRLPNAWLAEWKRGRPPKPK